MSETETQTRLCTLVPIGGQIIVKRDPPKTKTDGGILLPEMSKNAKRVQTGVVIRKGPGFIHPGSGKQVHVSDMIAPGVRIVMGEYAGTDYEHQEAHGREVYTVMQEAEVLCILGDGDTAVPIPDAATDQATLDEANAKAAEALAMRRESVKADIQRRGEEIANQMLGRSPGGIQLQ